LINFRYHIISLAAVFLALGLGLTLGSTFLDRTFVSALESQLNTLEGNLSDKKAELGEANEELDRATEADAALLDRGLVELAARPLDGMGIVPVVVEGVPSEVVDRFVSVATAAGADVPATLWLQESMDLAETDNLDQLTEALGLDGGSSPEERQTLVADAVSAALLASKGQPSVSGATGVTSAGSPSATTRTSGTTGASGPGSGTTVGVDSGEVGSGDVGSGDTPEPGTSSSGADNLAALLEGGFITATDEGVPISVIDTVPEDAAIVLIAGDGAVVPADGLARPLAVALAKAGPQRLVVSTCIRPGSHKDAAATSSIELRNEQIQPFRSESVITDNASTVDDLERTTGVLATVFAVAAQAEGTVGAYGLADGASGLMPELGG
jgi:hypothetical protein